MTDEWSAGQVKELMDERFASNREALKLQAEEYKRRLDDLNHEHSRALRVQDTYVTADKYEDKLAAEAQAREKALERIDERFVEFITRYELRQREVDQTIATARGAAEQARLNVEQQERRGNRNVGLATLVISLVVAFANGLFG